VVVVGTTVVVVGASVVVGGAVVGPVQVVVHWPMSHLSEPGGKGHAKRFPEGPKSPLSPEGLAFPCRFMSCDH
jgi:hypothetical protein